MTNETHNTNPVKTKHRRWFRFRLRTLLVMVTLLTVPLGWVGWELDQRRREKATIAWVEKLGGVSSGPFFDEKSWWEKTKGHWFGEMVWMVDLDRTKDIDLSPLAELKDLERITLNYTQVSDLSPLAEVKNLKSLDLCCSNGIDLSPLAELKNLEYLDLSGSNGIDLSPLAEVKNLKNIHLFRASVSEEQLQELRLALPNCHFHLQNVFD